MLRAILWLLLIVLVCRMAHVSSAAVVHAAVGMARALMLVGVGLLRAAVRA